MPSGLNPLLVGAVSYVAPHGLIFTSNPISMLAEDRVYLNLNSCDGR